MEKLLKPIMLKSYKKFNSFTIFETLIILLIFSLIFIELKQTDPKDNIDNLIQRIILYLKEVRYKALIDDKVVNYDKKWYMKRWTMKFFRCKNDIGLYYSIYSDVNKTGQVARDESLKDPFSNKHIYSSNACVENNKDSKYVLLTKNFNINKVNITCNTTSSLGQLSFSNDGKIYTKISSSQNSSIENILNDSCIIEFYMKNKKRAILIESTGYIEQI